MTLLSVHHITRYRYNKPARFGEYRLMFRPRDSHDLRLIESRLEISPQARVRWLHGVFSNSVAIASFDGSADELVFDSRIRIEDFGFDDPEFQISETARCYPFDYDRDEVADLESCMRRQDEDPDRKVAKWAQAFLQDRDRVDTQDLLVDMTRGINHSFAYERSYRVGAQAPAETLDLGRRSCRDLTLLMMSAVRALGFAARFVSGYLYDPSSHDPSSHDPSSHDPSGYDLGSEREPPSDEPPGSTLQGAGETHA